MKKLKPIKLTPEQYNEIKLAIKEYEKSYILNESGIVDREATIKSINIDPYTIFEDYEKAYKQTLLSKQLEEHEKTVVNNSHKLQLQNQVKQLRKIRRDREIEWRNFLKPKEDEMASYYHNRKIELANLSENLRNAMNELSTFKASIGE